MGAQMGARSARPHSQGPPPGSEQGGDLDSLLRRVPSSCISPARMYQAYSLREGGPRRTGVRRVSSLVNLLERVSRRRSRGRHWRRPLGRHPPLRLAWDRVLGKLIRNQVGQGWQETLESGGQVSMRPQISQEAIARRVRGTLVRL